MLVVQGFHPGDIDQSFRFAEWIRDLGGCRGHNLILIRDTRCPQAEADKLRLLFAESFDGVEMLDFVDHFQRWAESPNAVFSMAARYIEEKKPQPWLFCEPDCVVLKREWLDLLWQEYLTAKKPFLGDYVDVNNVEPHLSGNSIYPGRMTKFAGNALIAGDVAFDVVGASQILPQAHHSRLIHHSWKNPGFPDWQAFESQVLAHKPDACIFHADKTGSLYPLLRERLNLTPAGSQLHTAPSSRSEPTGAPASPPSSFVCDILIKSYPKDYERLSYCLRSIEKFADGFRQVVIVVPKAEYIPDILMGVPEGDLIRGWNFRIQIMELVENGEGYLVQQTCKASAHEWTDADMVLHLDSDCVLTQPITPETFLHHHRPIWYITPYVETQTPWQPYTEKFMGEPVEFECMRRFPFLIPRSLHLAISAFCMAKHKMRLTDYILSQPYREFSEFNALGALAYSRARTDFHWIDTTQEELPPPVLIQDYSHDELTAERKAEFEEILKGGDAECNAPAEVKTLAESISAPSTEQCRKAALKSEPESAAIQPWSDKTATLARAAELAAELRTFCTAPRTTAQIRDVLREHRVIK